MIITGRSLLLMVHVYRSAPGIASSADYAPPITGFQVGSPAAILTATLISGAFELIQRSSLVVIDEFIRVHVFREEINQGMRARQIKV